MKGGGLFDFSNVLKKFDKERIADCKDWLKRKQKGGRRPAKKRKPRKQTGAGKKRKPRKQTGKKSKPRKQTGKKSKSRKQTGRTANWGRSVNPENKRGAGLWTIVKDIFD